MFTAWTLPTISSERRDSVDSVRRSWRHVLTSLPGDGILEWRIWRKVNRIMGKTCLLIWHIDQSLQRPCKKAKTKTRLICFALIGCTLFDWVSWIADRRRQLSCVGEGVYSELNSTSSWVDLRRYKRAFRHMRRCLSVTIKLVPCVDKCSAFHHRVDTVVFVISFHCICPRGTRPLRGLRTRLIWYKIGEK